MRTTEQTLQEQMRITELDVEQRQRMLSFGSADIQVLLQCRPAIEAGIDDLVSRFYQQQTSIAEIALLIGDADTLHRLRTAQRRYVLDLFGGVYDMDYVNNRLRIGLVHKRIGVEPKLYLAGVQTLKQLLVETLEQQLVDPVQLRQALQSLDKLILFDITLVFETYIRSLVSEIGIAKEKSDSYARSLEEKVRERTQQLEYLTRIDSLTGLLNRRFLDEELSRSLRRAERRDETVCLVYMDVNGFKQLNDQHGHIYGDSVLRDIGLILCSVSRAEDLCFRYGGDEFCVILHNCEEAQAVELYVQRLLERLAERHDGLTLSIGIAHTGPKQYLSPEELIRQADADMYRAKHAATGPEA